MIRCQQYENNVYKEIDVDNQLMQEIATYIYEHYDKKITLDDMAERFHISRSYLSKKFKQATGFGFKEYLVNVPSSSPTKTAQPFHSFPAGAGKYNTCSL